MTTNNAEAILNALDSLIQCAADDGASGRVEYSPEIVRLRGEITAMFNTLASQPQAEREAVLWVNPDDLANRNFVGVNAVKAGHEQLGKHYTMPLFTHKPMQASGTEAASAIYELAERLWNVRDAGADDLIRAATLLRQYAASEGADGELLDWLDSHADHIAFRYRPAITWTTCGYMRDAIRAARATQEPGR